MTNISLPYHLIVPSIISFLILGLILFNRKRLFKRGKWKWFWISITLFFGIYFLIVVAVSYLDISLKLNLQKFDLNKDGSFNGAERTPELKAALHKIAADNGRNFACITGLIFSGIISIFVFSIGKIIEYIRR